MDNGGRGSGATSWPPPGALQVRVRVAADWPSAPCRIQEKTAAASWNRVCHVPENAAPLPDFTRWPSFPFEGEMRVKALDEPVAVEPPRHGEDGTDCVACSTPDEHSWK